MTIQPIQNVNSNIGISPSLQNKLNAVEANVVASPTPVISGAPIETNNELKQDSVELSAKKEKKFDSTLLLAFGIGIAISVLSALISKKIRKP